MATNTMNGVVPPMAPLRVPLQRRLQTMVVLFYGIEPSLVAGFFLFLCAIPLFWPCVFIYLAWMFFDKAPERGGRRLEWVRNLFLWKHFAEYYPIRIKKEADLDAAKNYIFGYHPHGIIAMGAVGTFAMEGAGFSELYPGIRPSLLTLAKNFNVPLHRDYLLALGLCSVSRKSCKAILRSGPGRSIAIVVGGAAESLNARPRVMDLTLKRRLGFVKIAVETGASLVPVLSFGENDLYDQLSNENGSFVRRFQQKMQQMLGFTMPLFHGRGVFNYDIGLMPHRRPMNIVIGQAIDPPADAKDRDADEVVKELHDRYLQSIQDLYDKYKDIYAPDRLKDLEFVE